jgi:hypothetical protein
MNQKKQFSIAKDVVIWEEKSVYWLLRLNYIIWLQRGGLDYIRFVLDFQRIVLTW